MQRASFIVLHYLVIGRSLALSRTRVPPPRMRAAAENTNRNGNKYGTLDYWDSMYQGSGPAADDGLPSDQFSWYCGWEELEPFWTELVPSQRARVLVPGVGNDHTVAALYDAGYTHVTAFDYSKPAVERAKELFHPRPITLLWADATALPFESGSNFDAVMDKGALDAIGIAGEAPLRAAVKELARVIAPGGVVMSVSRALEPDDLMGAFHADEGGKADQQQQWEVVRDGGLYIAETTGAVSTDLAAGLFAWRRL